MAEKEYIGRRALMEDARHDKAIMANLAGIADIANLINDQPTADVVEVVRCKDCAYSEKITDPLHGDRIRVCNFGLYKQAAPDMHYCSHGFKDGRKG